MKEKLVDDPQGHDKNQQQEPKAVGLADAGIHDPLADVLCVQIEKRWSAFDEPFPCNTTEGPANTDLARGPEAFRYKQLCQVYENVPTQADCCESM